MPRRNGSESAFIALWRRVYLFRFRFYHSKQVHFKSQRSRISICYAYWLPRLSTAPNVASGCTCRKRPNTPTHTMCVTIGNAGLAAARLRLPFALAPSGDDVGPTSNDL